MKYYTRMNHISLLALLSLFTLPAHSSSYQEVYDIVFRHATIQPNDNKIIRSEKSVYLENKLPAYEVTSYQFGKEVKKRLANRTQKTLVDKVDYYNRLEKLVHSNGICMAGNWYITESPKNKQGQKYTGMFAKGAISPFIGRLSVALSETKQGEPQGFGMAGKLFGTLDVNQPVITENFFVADVLTGTYRNSVFDAPMTNKPKIGFRFSVLGLGLKIAPLFSKADNNAGMRPITNIASIGLSDNQTVVSPKFMMISPIKPDIYSKNTSVIDGIDFRDEFAIRSVNTDNNTNQIDNTRQVHTENMTNARYFAIYVSDIASQPKDEGWQHIGFIKVDETIVSYGCDRQLHFNHPKSDNTSHS